MLIIRQKKFKRIVYTLQCLSLMGVFSCTSLSKSQILNYKKTEAISVLELKILHNGVEEKSNSGVFGECHLVFEGDNGAVKSNNADDYSFYVIKTKPGVVKIKALKCSNWIFYYKNRHLNLGDLEFIAKSDYINYLGNLVISYEPRGFGFLDIIGLGGIINDKDSSFDIKVYDNTEKSVKFLKEYYPELKSRNIVKSIIHNRKNGRAKLKDLEEREKVRVKTNTIDNSFKIENAPKSNEQLNSQGLNTNNNNQQGSNNYNNNQQGLNNNNNTQNPVIPNNNYQQPNNYRQPNYTSSPDNSQVVVPSVSPETQQNISLQPRSPNSVSITEEKISAEIPAEQINRNPNINNDRAIEKIIRRNKALRENQNSQPVNNPPISNQPIRESVNPISRFRPSDVQ